MKNVFKSLIVLVLVVISFSSCNSDDEPKTQVSVKLTDGPFPFNFATAANVTIDKIELKNENGDYIVVFEGNASYNMVDLTNGVTADFEAATVESGTYSEIKVTISDASVVLSNGTSFDTSSSDQVVEIAISPVLVVEEGGTSEVLLDLDLGASFSFSNSILGTFIGWINNIDSINDCSFHPHFRACDVNQTGEIEGTVNVEGSAYENAELHIEVNGETVSTHSEADGTFKFIGVSEGTYTVYASTENSGSTQVANVTVSGTNTATCDVIIN